MNVSIDQALSYEVVHAFLVFQLGHENHFGIAAADLLECFQVPDLHSCLGIQLISGLPHKFCRLDVGSCRNDLTFSQTALLCGTGERILQIFTELNILDENLFDLHKGYITSTPH